MTAIDSPTMSVQLPARPLTLDDVTVLAAADDLYRYELDEGRLVIVPPADLEDAALVTRLLVKLDREVKPAEYARARVHHFWRVDRDSGAVTVHLFTLGTDERGDPAYLGHRAELLDDLLTSPPPELS